MLDMGSNRGGGRGTKSVPPLDIELSDENAPGSGETSEKTAASNWGDYCVDTCLYHGHHDNKEMVRCCHCASWMHNDCIAQTEEFFPGVWSCFRCRLVPVQVLDLTSSVTALTKLVQDLSQTTIKLQKQHESTVGLLKEKDQAYQRLLTENQQLRQRVADVSSASSEETWRQLPRPHGTALFGSSIIRDIDQTKLVATKCVCIRGGHVKDIQASFDKFPSDHKLCRVILAVGGNDCDSGVDKPITDIVGEYKDLIESAKTIALSVTVSIVCPRRKSQEVTERIDALNAGLQVLCSDLQVDFVDNNPAFHLQDGSFNDGFLLPDNVHLTRAATNKLVSNLKLELRQGHTTAHTDHRRRGHTPDTPSDFPSDESDPSDDDLSAIDAAHPFWQKVVYKSRPRQSKQSGRNPGKQNGQKPHLPSPSQRQPSSPPTTAQRRAPADTGVHQARRHGVPGSSTRQPKSAITSRPTPIHPNQRHPHATSNAPTPLIAIQTHPALPQRSEDRCQLCLGNGHTAVSCMSKSSQCYKCSQYGHLARACVYA